MPALRKDDRVEMGPNGRYIVCSEKECGFVVPSGEIKTLIPTLRIKRRHGTEKGVISFPGDFARARRGDELFLMQHDADRHKNIKREQGGGKQ